MSASRKSYDSEFKREVGSLNLPVPTIFIKQLHV